MSTTNDVLYHMGGVPVHGEMTTGSCFFVHSGTGSDGNTGKKPSAPFKTMDKATNSCTANKNDIVYVMPNHTEDLATATAWVPDVAGVQYIGIGMGSDMPNLTFSETTSIINVGGESNTFRNFRFTANKSAIVVAVEVGAHHATFDGCTWEIGATSTFDFLTAVSIDSYDFLTVKNCRFHAKNATAGALQAIHMDAADFCIIENNLFTGDYSLTVIANHSTDAAGVSLLIADNNIYNDDTATTAGGGISLRSACTGIIKGNYIGSLSTGIAADPQILDPGSCLMFENYVCNAIDHYGSQALTGTAST